MPELWYQHWLDLIAKYGKERFGRDIPMDKLRMEPMWKIAGWTEDAWSYYKMNDRFFSLDEVPEEYKDGRTVYIRTKGRTSNYNWIDGEWRRFGYIDDEWYKG